MHIFILLRKVHDEMRCLFKFHPDLLETLSQVAGFFFTPSHQTKWNINSLVN